MKIPREIDELMWEVSELDDLETIDQFGARYPEFRNELVKRIQMVRSLRGSRPKSATPQFVERQNVRNLGPSRLAIAMVSVIVIASMTFATYATVQYVRSTEEPTTASTGTEYVLNAPTFTDGEDRDLTPDQIEQNLSNLPPDSVLPLQEFDAFQFAVTVESVNTTLVEVINEIARVTGTEIVFAPGFEDAPIRLTYVEQPAMGVLHDLGRRFGFTPSRQGATTMLIFPAPDTSGQQTTTAYGAAELITETEDSSDVADGDEEVSDGEAVEQTGADIEDKDEE